MTWGGLGRVGEDWGESANTKWYTVIPTYCIIKWQSWVEFKQYPVVYFKSKPPPTKWLASSSLPTKQYSDLCNHGSKSVKWKLKLVLFLLLVVRLPCFLDQFVVFIQSCKLSTNWTKTTVVTVLWQAEAFPCSPQKQVLIKHQLRSHHLHTGQRGLCWTDNVNKHTTFLHLYKQRSKFNLVQQYDGRNRSILSLHPLGGWTRKVCAPSTLLQRILLHW